MKMLPDRMFKMTRFLRGDSLTQFRIFGINTFTFIDTLVSCYILSSPNILHRLHQVNAHKALIVQTATDCDVGCLWARPVSGDMTSNHLSTPRDKHDFASLELIEASEPSAWVHLVPELLIWLQDPNWPISGRVKDILLLNPMALLEPLRLVLAGDDETWQYNSLDLVLRLPRDTQSLLRADLEAFSARISDESDLDWGLRSDVKEILSRIVT